jgi:thiamine-monophosphate kinase
VPQPRSALAQAVRDHASASMDVSDGLAGDLVKLLATSDVAATISTADVPLSEPTARLVRQGTVSLETLLSGGDDYEILCTIPPVRLASFMEEAQHAGVTVTAIGTVQAGAGARFVNAQGAELILSRLSYSHF